MPLPVHDFGDFLSFAEEMGVEGVSVTIPFKLDALQCRRVERCADAAGRRRQHASSERARSWEATNTDVEGFLQPLGSAWGPSLNGVRASVLGAGGAARAVIVALASRGAQVTVHARREEQAQELARDFNVASRVPIRRSQDRGTCWSIARRSAAPLAGSESPMPADRLTGRLVYDLTYGAGRGRAPRATLAAPVS